MRAAIYARVSSATQRDRHTIESQLRDAPAYATSQGWTVAATYIDDGRSAKAGRLEARDGYARMIREAKAGAFDVVVVVAVDRLTRSEDPVERAQIIASITATGCKLAIVGAGIQDPRTFAGDAYVTLQALFAAEENRKRRERAVAGQVTSAQRGRNPRGRPPYGLTFDGAAWRHDPERADVVREVFARVAGGESTYSISLRLNARGVARPRGGRWSAGRIQDLIASDVYLGRYLTDARRGLSVPVPPIVTPELAHEARQVMLARYRRPPARTTRHPLLAGVARCGLCGEPIGIGNTTDRATGTQPATYCCLSRRYYRRTGERPCELRPARVAEVDAALWPALVDAIDAAAIERWIAASARQPTANVADARAEIARTDRAQDAVLSQLARGLIAQEVADAQIARLAERRRVALDALSEAQRADQGLRAASDQAAVEEALAAFRRGAEVATIAERRALVRAVVEAAVLRDESLALDLRVTVRTVTAPGAAAASWTGAPVKLGRLRVAVPRPERRRAA